MPSGISKNWDFEKFGNLVFALVVLSAYILFFSNGGFTIGLTTVIIVLILGLVYLALGTIGFQRALAAKSKYEN